MAIAIINELCWAPQEVQVQLATVRTASKAKAQ